MDWLEVGLDWTTDIRLLNMSKVILLVKFRASPDETRRDDLVFSIDERGRMSDCLQRAWYRCQLDVFEGALRWKTDLISTVV